MPGQAIRCTLAHLTIPPHLSQAATQAMMHLTDITDSWKVKVSNVAASHLIVDLEILLFIALQTFTKIFLSE